MTNIENIELVLERMAELLYFAAFDGWANALKKFRNEISVQSDVTAAGILSMYGGMGSLNDLILYKNGQLLAAENVELDALRTRLYQLCHEIQ